MSKKFYAYQGSRKERALSTIVAIGASPGGLEAAVVLFSHLPADTGMCFLYVEHLDHTRKNDPVTSIQEVTEMPVKLVLEAMPLQPNHVYIIPPNREIQIAQDRFSVHALPERPAHRLPADRLFTTLAAAYAQHVIGIVLSGVTHDGTVGLQAIKAVGGLGFVQDDTALFKNMPRSALAAGVADKVLSPQQMAVELQWLAGQLVSFGELTNDNSDIHDILHLVQTATSIDFADYKPGNINRRIVKRMLLQRLNTLKEYQTYLQQHKEEIDLLCHDLLIQVTGFFNDATSMQYIRQHLLPKIFQNRAQNEPLRIWVAACSTGEEAYFIAILLQEYMETQGIDIPVKIFATDASKTAIAKARKGIYSKSEVAGLSPERLERFFIRVNNQYKATDALRDCCIFSAHNVLKDPPFSRIRLISCCNLFIHLKRTAQEKLLSTLHSSLLTGGYLVLGRSETVPPSTPLFEQIDEHSKIFIKENITEPDNWSKEADDIITARFLPAAVIVNHQLDILQFRGSTGKFLEHLPGKASLNLMDMTRPQLAMAIKNAINELQRTNKEVNSIQQRTALKVIPLSRSKTGRFFLIIFSELPEPKRLPVPKATAAIGMLHDISEAPYTKTEETGPANEELLAINKILQRMNNELQQFAYVASHDLQEPLRKIITFSDLLNQRFNELLPDAGRIYIEKIIASALRMSHLLQDLLNYSQLANTGEVFSNIDLNDIVTGVVVKLRNRIQQKKAQVRFDALPVIQGIPHQMELLFHHLLSNALKFAHPQRAPLISISVKKLSRDKLQQFEKLNPALLYYEIVVTDNGIGFNQEFASQIFVIFQRLNDKHDYSGTGIGLALCRKITDNHNGEIYARSKEGEGSAFHIILPAKQP